MRLFHFMCDFNARCSRVYQVEEEVKFNYKRTNASSVHCSLLSTHPYSSKDGKQIVSTTIKQEQLKKLNELTEIELSTKLREAFSNIPHANARRNHGMNAILRQQTTQFLTGKTRILKFLATIKQSQKNQISLKT